MASASSPAEFSLVVAALVDTGELDTQQRLLECTSTIERLEDLLDCVQSANSYFATQAALRRLGGSFGAIDF